LSVGRQVVVKTTERIVGDSHRVEGVIADADDEGVRLRNGEDDVVIPYDAVKSARTVFEWK
jgi:ribosome maturation factor RimP